MVIVVVLSSFGRRRCCFLCIVVVIHVVRVRRKTREIDVMSTEERGQRHLKTYPNYVATSQPSGARKVPACPQKSWSLAKVCGHRGQNRVI